MCIGRERTSRCRPARVADRTVRAATHERRPHSASWLSARGRRDPVLAALPRPGTVRRRVGRRIGQRRRQSCMARMRTSAARATHANAATPATRLAHRPRLSRIGHRTRGIAVPKEYVRLTTPLVRDGDRLTGTLRPATWDEALERVVAGCRRRARRTAPGPTASSRAASRPTRSTTRRRSSSGPSWAATTSTAATAPDTPPLSPVWRPCSALVAEPAHIVKPKRRTSSSCGARTPGRRIRSSSTTS